MRTSMSIECVEGAEAGKQRIDAQDVGIHRHEFRRCGQAEGESRLNRESWTGGTIAEAGRTAL